MKTWIKTQRNYLDGIDHYDEIVADDLRDIITEAERKAAESGIPGAVLACQIREGGISPALARKILHVCLAHSQAGETALPTEGPLTVKQAAAFLNVSQNTIYAACESNALRHLRIGEGRGTIRINREALESFKRQNQTIPIKDYLS